MTKGPQRAYLWPLMSQGNAGFWVMHNQIGQSATTGTTPTCRAIALNTAMLAIFDVFERPNKCIANVARGSSRDIARGCDGMNELRHRKLLWEALSEAEAGVHFSRFVGVGDASGDA